MGGAEGRLLRIEVLGSVRAWLGTRELLVGPPRQRAVLAMLALQANRTVSRDELVDGVWGVDPPASAVNGVQTYVSALRRELEPGRGRRAAGRMLVSVSSGYRLAVEPGQLDAEVFGAHIDRGRQLVGAGEAADAVAAYNAAIALWQGTALSGVPGPFAQAARNRLAELRLAATEDRAEAMLGLGHDLQLVAELTALTGEHPLRERLRALLMTALYRAGRQAEALAVYADTRRFLVDELGIEPGSQLQHVHRDILNNGDTDQGRDRQRARPPTLPRQLPAPSQHFTGRAVELATLSGLVEDAVRAGTTVVISAIDGTAGIGKTALALHWAHRIADRFPDGQLYVNLRGFDPTGSPLAPTEAVRGFLHALAVPPERVPAGLDAQTALYRSLLAGRRMLVVLDNARDTAQVRPLLPGTPGCLAVVTSRNTLTGLVAVEGAYPLTLDLLAPAEARDLLARRLGRARVATEPGIVEEIVGRCARLPLALSVVAARAAAHPRFPLAALAAELRDAHTRLDVFNGGDETSNVRTVFSWSYQRLSAPAARSFRLLALHPGPDVTAPAAASLVGIPLERAREALNELAGAHLVAEHAPGRYSSHDLLRAYATELAHAIDTDDERRQAVRRVLDHYLHTARTAALLLYEHRDPIEVSPPQPGVLPEALADHEQALCWLTAEERVLLAAIGNAADQRIDGHAWQLAWTLVDFFDFRGRWHEHAVAQRTALGAARRLADRPGQALMHRGLARACLRLDRHDEAHTHLQHALGLYRQLGDRAGQAYAHLNLARVFDRQVRHSEALHHAEQALDLYRAAGHRHGQSHALNNIGWYHAQLGDYQQALGYAERALTLLREIGDSRSEGGTWDTLGYAYHHIGHHHQAIACYRHALDLFRNLGDRYVETEVLIHLGDAYDAAGDPPAARGVWQQALTILDDLDHTDADRVRMKLHRLDTGYATGKR